MAERKLSLIILGKATSALAAMKSTGDAAQSLGKRVTDLLPSFKTIAIAGAAAFGAVGAAALTAVKAAAQDQESQKKLADQLRRTTDATNEQIASAEEYISTLMMATGVADDQLRPALANLVRSTQDVGFAQQQLGLALDISTATGKDLESVSLALGKAFTGNISALTRLGIPLDQSVVKSKNLAEIIKTLNTQFGGAASAAANTFSGRLRILQTSIGEAVEGIGYALLPVAERMVAFFQTKVVPVVQAFADELAGGGGLRDALLAAGAQAGSFGLKIVDAVETMTKVFATFSNLFIAFARPVIFALGAIASGFTLILTRSVSAARETGAEFRNVYDTLGDMKISTDSVSSAFDNFRNDLLGVAAAANVTQGQLRATEQAARQAASGTSNIVKPFIGPLLDGYGALAPKTKTAAQLQEEFATTLAKLQASAGGAGSTLKKAADAVKTYTDALIGARNATRAKDEATKNITRAQEDLDRRTRDVTKAQQHFDRVVSGFPATSREAIDATRKFSDAQRSLRDAGLQVADAVRNVEQAENALAKLRARQADVQKVASAERRLERSKFGVEEANFRIADAEQALAELRLDPQSSPIAIRRAEIDLAEAKLGVFDAVQSLRDAEEALNAERNAAATADEIAEAERNLERAKYAVSDAIEAQTRATQEQTSAQETLNEITFGAVVGSTIYNEALRDLEDAQRSQRDAADSLADAFTREKDAIYELAEALKVLKAVEGKTSSKVISQVQGGVGFSVGGSSIASTVAGIDTSESARLGDTYLTLNVESGLTNPQETASVVIDALGRYVRSNGFIPIDASAFIGAV